MLVAVICIYLKRELYKTKPYLCLRLATIHFWFFSLFFILFFIMSFGSAQLCRTLCAPSCHTAQISTIMLARCLLPFIHNIFFSSSFDFDCKINTLAHTYTHKIEFNNSYYNRSQFTLYLFQSTNLNDIFVLSEGEKMKKKNRRKIINYFHFML